jgi:hypothetical protein
MTSPFVQKINNIKNEFFMNFRKKYVPSDKKKLRDEITGFDGSFSTYWHILLKMLVFFLLFFGR